MSINNNKKTGFVLGEFTSNEAEKLRFLRTNFLSAVNKSVSESKIILCVADSKAEEIAHAVLNLGCALTAVGKKILVLDIDRKNAKVHQCVAKSNKTYNDYLAGNAKSSELSVQTNVDGLDVIVSDADNAVSMRDDAKMFELLAALRDNYDYILVVATPIKEGADAFSCDEAADAVIMFVKKGGTSLGLVRKMLDYYNGRGRLVLGTVLI